MKIGAEEETAKLAAAILVISQYHNCHACAEG
jgi:hypothetical protein